MEKSWLTSLFYFLKHLRGKLINFKDVSRLATCNTTVKLTNSLVYGFISMAFSNVRMNRQIIVFADKKNWKFFKAGKIQTLPKNTFINRTIPEKNGNETSFFLNFICQRCSDCDWDSCSNNRGGKHHIFRRIGKMH